jgi:hypothetical protein
VPDFGILDGATNTTIINMTNGDPILQEDGHPIDASKVLDAIKYLTDLLNLRGLAEKVQ